MSSAEKPVVQSFIDEPWLMSDIAERVRRCLIENRPSKGLVLELAAFATRVTWAEAEQFFPDGGVSAVSNHRRKKQQGIGAPRH